MSAFRLQKRQIIKKSDVFTQIFEKGIPLHSDHILLLSVESDQCRFGFAVSKNIKGAVKRNRAKRRLREILRLNQSHLPGNRNIILVAKPGIEQAKFKNLNQEFLRLLKELDVNVIQ
jgi:ribonuclease P protein component